MGKALPTGNPCSRPHFYLYKDGSGMGMGMVLEAGTRTVKQSPILPRPIAIPTRDIDVIFIFVSF